MPNQGDKFAQWIEALRDQMGLTQRALAELLSTDDYPIDHTAVGTWERGEFPPRPAALRRLAEVSGVDLYWLAHLAWGWPAPDEAPPEMDPRHQAAVIELKALAEERPDRLDEAFQMIQVYRGKYHSTKAATRKRKPRKTTNS